MGYVISGSAKLEIEGQTLKLKRGNSWLVPAGATHNYTITEPFDISQLATRAQGRFQQRMSFTILG